MRPRRRVKHPEKTWYRGEQLRESMNNPWPKDRRPKKNNMHVIVVYTIITRTAETAAAHKHMESSRIDLITETIVGNSFASCRNSKRTEGLVSLRNETARTEGAWCFPGTSPKARPVTISGETKAQLRPPYQGRDPAGNQGNRQSHASATCPTGVVLPARKTTPA